MVDFVEICNICARKAVIEAAKRIINSYKMCRSYSDFNFGVTFLEHSVVITVVLYTLEMSGNIFFNPILSHSQRFVPIPIPIPGLD